MKLAYRWFESVLEAGEKEFLSIIIEEPTLLWNFLSDCKQAIEGSETGVVLSENDRPLAISKCAMLFTDYIDFQINQKSLVTKIAAELDKQAMSGVYYQRTQEILTEIEQLVNDLTILLPCELQLEKLSMQAILKAAGISVLDDYDSLEEKIIAYLELVREYEGKNYFIFYNLRSFVPAKRFSLLMETLLSRGYRMVLVDLKAECLIEGERRMIIDQDLCEI